MLDAKLTVVGGDAKKADIRFKEPMLVGRGSDCSLPIRHKLVSRKHCEIFEKKGYLYVKDLESLNGTFIDNERIEGTKVLKPNQLLTIGNITLRALYEPGKQIETAQKIDEQANAEPVAGNDVRIDDVTVYQPQLNRHSGSALPPLPVSQSVEKTTAVPTRQTVASGATKQAQKSDVLDETLNDLKSPSNTDPSIVTGSEVTVDDGVQFGGQKSVSLSSLDQLKTNQGAAQPISKVDLDRDNTSNQKQVSPSSLVGADFFDEDGDDSADENADSRLGSFIRKLPR